MQMRQRSTFCLAFAIATIAALGLYLHIARIQSGVNRDLNKSDQSAYMDFAIKAYESDFHYTGGRNRMPMFPWLMAIFYATGIPNEAFFTIGKLINSWLSALMLLLLGAAFIRRFSKLYAAYAMLCIAFLAYVLKAPFFQAELLFYGFFAAAYIFSLEYLEQPSWQRALAVGLLLALAHFTKASALPALILFLASVSVHWLRGFVQQNVNRNEVFFLPGHTLLALIAFMVLLLPYLHESYQHYGSHFYNVNTTFYVWYDSWMEAKAGAKAAGDREGYPDLSPEEIPSIQKYLREHSAQQIIDRFRIGAQRLFEFGCTREDSVHRYGYCSQVILGLALLAVCLPLLLEKASLRELLDKAHKIVFTLAIFVVYALGAAWYMPITGNQGPRVLLVLIVPFFWTLGLATHASALQAFRVQLGRSSIKLINLVYALLSVSLGYEIVQVVAFRAAVMYGGK